MTSCGVLVVDDECDSAELVKRHLNGLDSCNVYVECDVSKAVLKVREKDFDVVVSDFDMGDLTGLEFFDRVKGESSFILFTGKGSEEVASKAISAGVTDYIRKGGSEQYERLKNRVEKVLERKKTEKELEKQKVMLEKRSNTLERFHDISTSSKDFEAKIDEILSLGIEYFGVESGILSKVEGYDYIIKQVKGFSDEIRTGEVIDLEDTFCQTVVESEGTVYYNREFSDDIERHPAYGKQELEVYIGIPIFVDGEIYGTLNFSSTEKIGRRVTEVERTIVRLMAEWVGKEISRKRSMEKAEAREERLRQVIDNLPQLVFAKDEEGKFILANEAVADAYGTTVHELEGQTDEMFVDSEQEVKNFRKDDKKVIESGDTKHIPEEPLTTAKGEKKILQTTKIPYQPVESNKKAVLGVSHDITEQKEKERRLEMQSSAMEASMDGIAITDSEGNFIYMNEAHARMFGRSPEYFRGKSWKTLYPESEVERIKSNVFKELEEEGSWIGETIGVHCDGSEIIQEITLTVMDDGKMICTNRDVTEQRQSKIELEEKNRRLDEFSSIVSHDLRNPLNVAMGYLDLSKESMDKEDLEKVENSLNRMKNIIDELLAVSGDAENFQKETLTLSEALEEALDSGNRDVDYFLSEDLELKASRTGLVNIFDNMISNSINHNGKDVSIEVGKTETGFYYTDDGSLDVGIEDIVQHGYSTSDEGRGLGISIIKRLASANDWDVELRKSVEGSLVLKFKI